tara:strand:- start:27304 stop:27654 length:351 start_codon:yes stop_codon:yes gene_type:complete
MDEIEQLIVDTNYPAQKVTLYFRQRRGDKHVFVGYDGKELVETKVNPMEIMDGNVTPLLVLPMRMYDTLLRMFANNAREKGIQTENENITKGKLIATQDHLADLKKIVMKQLKIDE